MSQDDWVITTTIFSAAWDSHCSVILSTVCPMSDMVPERYVLHWGCVTLSKKVSSNLFYITSLSGWSYLNIVFPPTIVNDGSRHTEPGTIAYGRSKATTEDHLPYQSSMSSSSLSSGNLSPSSHGCLKISLSGTSLEMSPKASSVKESTFNAIGNPTRGTKHVFYSYAGRLWILLHWM